MKESSAKKNILKRIKKALEKPVPLPFTEPGTQDFFSLNEDLELLFAEKFTSLQGRFSFCATMAELVLQLQTLFTARDWKKIYLSEPGLKQKLIDNGFKADTNVNLADCNASITTCEYLIARTGSIVVSSAKQGRTSSIYAPVHICIAFTDQLVFDVKDGLELIKQKYSSQLPSLVSFATGPSRTADIEKTLVTGVHGPKEVFCFLLQAKMSKE